MSIKRPEKKECFFRYTPLDKEGYPLSDQGDFRINGYNQGITEYDAYLTDLLKEVRRLYESMNYYSSAPYPTEAEMKTAIIDLIERTENEN